MGLSWIRNTWKKRFQKQDGETKVATSPNNRILFIGFGKIPGYASFEWGDWNWLNAADYDAVFINCQTLNEYINYWQGVNEKSEEKENDSHQGAFKHICENLSQLYNQVLQIINSNRQIFTLATPSTTAYRPFSNVFSSSIYTYSWCPLPIEITEAEGDVIKVVDNHFSDYCTEIKRWNFYFTNKPKILKHFRSDDLYPGNSYASATRELFTNLSLLPLGIELRYAAINITPTGEFVTKNISGPIYLLHYPVGGNVTNALNILLKEFFNLEIKEAEKPLWVEQIPSPNGKALDSQINQLSSQIEELQAKKDELIAERQRFERWRKLLYESGNALEHIVLDALVLLGLANAEFGSKSDHDIIGEIDNEKVIFEVKGLSKNAGRNEVFSLARHIDEYELKNPDMKISKGILVVNAYRNDPPDERDNKDKRVFADDAIKHSDLLHFALLDTRVLYKAVCDKIENGIDGSDFLKAMKNTTGIFEG